MRATTTVNDESLKNSLAVSAGLHVLLILFMYFGLPVLFTPLPSHHEPVPFEIVQIADITNTRIEKPHEQEKPPAPPPAPAAKPQPAPQAQPAPTPPKTPEKVAAMPLPIPKPVQKPKPKPKPEQQKQQDTASFDKLLKDVAKLKPQTASKADSKAEAKPQPEQQTQAPALSDRLTITEEDALRRQLAQCWNLPTGAKDAQNLIVHISVDVNPDRTVQHAEILDQSRMVTDSFFRAAAEAALRAVYNPKCSPLQLPPDKYDEWKHIDFTFDPREMF